MLTLDSVTKRYHRPEGTVHALDSVSLAAQAGEFIAVKGPSGCGKTTLLLTAGGLLAPDGGTVTVAGIDPYRLSVDDRARFRAGTIGFVFQQFYLIPYLSVFENVLAPSIALPRIDSLKRARELTARFNLTHRMEHLPSELSTGERQRTALARALLNEPKLLLADEPTGNLDTDNADTVLGYFREFAESGGAVLMVTHSDPVGHVDRVMQIEQGAIVDE